MTLYAYNLPLSKEMGKDFINDDAILPSLEIKTRYKYVNNQRTDIVDYYFIEVVLQKFGYEKVSVRFSSIPEMLTRIDENALPILVGFEDLKIGFNYRGEVYAVASDLYEVMEGL